MDYRYLKVTCGSALVSYLLLRALRFFETTTLRAILCFSVFRDLVPLFQRKKKQSSGKEVGSVAVPVEQLTQGSLALTQEQSLVYQADTNSGKKSFDEKQVETNRHPVEPAVRFWVRDAAREAALREIKERIKKTKDEKKAKKAEVMSKQKTMSNVPKGAAAPRGPKLGGGGGKR